MGTITENNEANGTSSLEAKTNAELTAELATVKGQLRELRVRLWGDEELREKWAENKRTYVTPNIPEPPVGHLDKIEDGVLAVANTTASLQRLLDLGLSEMKKNFEFVDRVGAWIGSLMDDSQFRPPLNGAQIASKKYVDEAMARLSGALREEMSEPQQFVKSLYAIFSQILDVAAVRFDMQPVDKRQHRLTVLSEIASRLAASWQYVAEKRSDEDKPGAIGRLRIAAKYIISGRPQKQA